MQIVARSHPSSLAAVWSFVQKLRRLILVDAIMDLSVDSMVQRRRIMTVRIRWWAVSVFWGGGGIED
jgi:hypothetical protein